MGTKFECAINPFASSQNSNSCNFTLHFSDDYFRTRVLEEDYQNIIGLDLIRSSMDDKNMGDKNMEFIKKTMQMQEDIFKHQVRELHRLYSVQKMLMDEVNREMKKTISWTATSDININININHNFRVRGDHPSSSRERSGSCSASADTTKIPKPLDLEIRLADEDMPAEASAIEEDRTLSRTKQLSMEGSDHDSDVELTLSIGGSSSNKKTSNMNKSKPGDHGQELGIKDFDSISSSSKTLDQETKRPHWLFQGLSINRTS